MHQDAGSNPGSGKRFYFSMTRFVHDTCPPHFQRHNCGHVIIGKLKYTTFNLFLKEIIVKSPFNKWQSHFRLVVSQKPCGLNANPNQLLNPHCEPQRELVEYSHVWQLSRWVCRFHVVCLVFVRIRWPMQTRFLVEYWSEVLRGDMKHGELGNMGYSFFLKNRHATWRPPSRAPPCGFTLSFIPVGVLR